jgi:Fe-S-cluster containining protein
MLFWNSNGERVSDFSLLLTTMKEEQQIQGTQVICMIHRGDHPEMSFLKGSTRRLTAKMSDLRSLVCRAITAILNPKSILAYCVGISRSLITTVLCRIYVSHSSHGDEFPFAKTTHDTKSPILTEYEQITEKLRAQFHEDADSFYTVQL